jgi:hypothetical protein
MKIIKFPKSKITKSRWFFYWKRFNTKHLLLVITNLIMVLMALGIISYMIYKINNGI